MNLFEYVVKNTVRGACTCGRCVDAPVNPGEEQPQGHTVDLTFFKVAAGPEADAQEFLRLVKEEHPEWLDNQEHNYLEVGGAMGDQGVALMTIGLGHVLNVWLALCPEVIFPQLTQEMKLTMAESGMVALISIPPQDREAVTN